VDHRDAFLDDPRLTLRVVKFLKSPRLKILYDIYHMQIMGGDILSFVRENLEHIGHFHIAGVPGRHEPYLGELDYPRIIREVSAMGYTGCFGLEYWPLEAAEISLKKSLACLSPPG
jgi:hydroxypyruvate isomerase